jgi:hypothetical protein
MRIFKQHENFLWNRPSIAAKAMDIPAVKGEIYNAGKSMPSRFHRAIGGHAGLRSVLEDLAAMPNTAKLADLNDIRSDLLGIARTDAEPIIRKIAGDLAAAMLKAIERNPALRADPAAWADYVAARDFTHTKWNTIGQKPFQNIIKAGADDRRAGGSLFGFGNPISGERIPQGMSQVIDALEDIRDQWRVLATRGLDPTVADAAARELGQGAVDYIINSMIQPVAASTSGATAGQLNDLQQWIARNRGWLVSSRLLEPAQLDLLDNIATASKMGAAPANLRGGTGSETFERLMSNNNPRIIDIFSTALNKRIFAAGGAMIGSYLGHLGEAGIGFLLGSGVERIGLQMLHHMYEMPTEQLRAKLIEAANNPQIAADLMQTARQAKGFSDATIAWLRGLGGEAGGGLGAWFENDRVRAGAGTPTPSVGR